MSETIQTEVVVLGVGLVVTVQPSGLQTWVKSGFSRAISCIRWCLFKRWVYPLRSTITSSAYRPRSSRIPKLRRYLCQTSV
jgi:hypothetical protein